MIIKMQLSLIILRRKIGFKIFKTVLANKNDDVNEELIEKKHHCIWQLIKTNMKWLNF